MHRTLPILALFLTSGCNVLLSREPWFEASAAPDAPQLRPGLWNWTSDASCSFDESAGVDDWPACAEAALIRPGQFLGMRYQDLDAEGNPARKFEGYQTASYVLAPGDPHVLQVGGCLSALKQGGMDVERDASGYDFCYFGLRAAKTDNEGRITAFTRWIVQCGPEPSGDRRVTGKPYPGIRIVEDNCEAESAAAVRDAARASEAGALRQPGGDTRIHWVRDAER